VKSAERPDVLFVLPYPIGRAPSQRFRVEMLLPLLDAAGLTYELAPFLDDAAYSILYRGGLLAKAGGILKGFARRIGLMMRPKKRRPHTVFIHREAAPVGPPIFEWWMARVWRARVVYDFDDAIWIPLKTGENPLAHFVKAQWKVSRICSWSAVVSGGNRFLCNYAAAQKPRRVELVPTVVNTDTRYNQLKQHGANKPVVGWTGSHSTLLYLEDFVPIIRRLQERLDFTFLVIADKEPNYDLRDWQFVPWNAQREIDDLLRMDVGVMPLHPDPWAEGKCGFKIIQYLALGIPAVASPVGVNKTIITEGVNGFLAANAAEWEAAMERLINDTALRAQLGAAGRQRVVEDYSVRAIADRFVGLFSR